MVVSYVPNRGDIVKIEFGGKEKFTPDLIKRIFTLQLSEMSFDDIAMTLNNEIQHGREQTGYRPALIISPKRYNQMSSLILACPITSNAKCLSFEVPLPEGMQTTGVILTDQIKAQDWRSRKIKFVELVLS